MYPKSKSPSESKYERLRGMYGGAGENVRYIPVGNGIQQSMAGHGGIWLVLCVYQYISIRTAWRQGRHGRTEAQYTNATMDILVYDIQTQYTTAITGASQRPGACIACACARVRALYYYIIIILLYYYIYIYPIYPVYPIYPTMVI